MARPANTVESVSMTITVTPQIKAYLEDLVFKGTYGQSPAEVVRTVLGERIREYIKDGALKEREWELGPDGKLRTVKSS